VLAADERKVTIPLSSIFDVAVGHVPQGLGEFFSATVTVACERSDSRIVAAVAAGDDKIEKFTTVLFKALLNGTDMTVRPARVGGRVTGFERLAREVNGTEQSVLAVRHMPNGQAMTTLAATQSGRKMSILGRYLRLEYSDLMSDLEDVELAAEQVETLVAIYSTGPAVSLAAVLDMEASQVTMVLNDLTPPDR